MSATAAILTNDEYEERKRFLDDIRALSKSELEELYRILKKSRAEFSENSNGVFFDLCKLPDEVFSEMKKFMEFCHKTRDDEAQREEEERMAQEALVLGRD
jgi:hypothetical protein